jgi:hypothetical protein
VDRAVWKINTFVTAQLFSIRACKDDPYLDGILVDFFDDTADASIIKPDSVDSNSFLSRQSWSCNGLHTAIPSL